jgi:hypothetical protein
MTPIVRDEREVNIFLFRKNSLVLNLEATANLHFTTELVALDEFVNLHQKRIKANKSKTLKALL